MDLQKIYLWPFSNEWYFDEEDQRYAQRIAIVRPVDVLDQQSQPWPGFIAVEYLDDDLNPIGIHNFLLPRFLLSLDGDPIAPTEAVALLQEF